MKKLVTFFMLLAAIRASAQNCNILSQLNADGSYTLTPASLPPGAALTWFHDSIAINSSPSGSVTGSQGCYYFVMSNSGGQTCSSNLVCLPGSACSGNSPSFTVTTSGLNATFANTSATPPAGLYAEYTWHFGDGTSDTAGNPIHTYNAVSVDTVTLVSNWYDTQTNLLQCSDTFVHVVNVVNCSVGIDSMLNTNGTITLADTVNMPGATYQWYLNSSAVAGASSQSITTWTSGCYMIVIMVANTNCASNVLCITPPACAIDSAGFTYSISNDQVSFTNTSTGAYNSLWDFGDLSTSSLTNPVHTYAAPGTYNVHLTATYVDVLGNTLCTHTSDQLITVVPNNITGNIIIDSNAYTADDSVYKVWLISYDSSTTTLAAVDSQVIANTWSNVTTYSFINEPVGNYYIKAQVTSAPAGVAGPVPTYASSSLYWNAAALVNYWGGTVYTNIVMQVGTNTGGPGFVGGNISSGANKGTHTTGVAVAGLTVLLEDATGHPVAYTITDANGDYTFSNLATGTYRVYPEALNYETTPWTAIQVTASGASQINFQQHTVSKTITPAPSSVNNVNAAITDITVFPNPSKGIVNLSWNKALNNTHVSITDMLGRKAMETDLNLFAAEGRVQLSLASLKPGVYFMTVTSGDLSYNTKLILDK